MWKLIINTLKSFILTISALIPILGFIGINDYNTLIDKFKTNNYFILIMIISIIIFLSISFGEYIFKGNRLKYKSDLLHAIFHDLRNFTFHRTFTLEEFEKITENICKYLDKFSTHKFHVCIKTLKFHKNTPCKTRDKIEKLSVETLVRCGNNIDKRKSTSQITHLVNDNTDFSSILFDKKCNIFSCSNLLVHNLISKILNPSQQYKNSDENYYKKYLTNIVVPIRIHKNFFKINGAKKYVIHNDYITVGFLCIDCRWPISRALRKEINGVAKAIADSLFWPLYHYINI